MPMRKTSKSMKFHYRQLRWSRNRRNYGYGKQLCFAAWICLLWIYGEGHYLTRTAHHARFRQFAHFIREQFGIRDIRHARHQHVEAYATFLAQKVAAEEMAVSYAQNCLSSVNVILEGFRRDRKLWIAPAKKVGKRSHVRTELPGGTDWSVVISAACAIEQAGHPRAAAVVLLARAFGMRLREAALAGLPRLKHENARYGHITILEGTKGGRRSQNRRVAVEPAQQAALQYALSVSPDGSHNLLTQNERWIDFLRSTCKKARPALKNFGIKGFHSLRAARLIELYETTTDQPAPIRGEPIDPELHEVGRRAVAIQAGHGEHRTSVAYIGGVRKNGC